MLRMIRQNILKIPAGIIVHQVNCQGVMGTGLAKQIKLTYPRVFDEYSNKTWKLGDIQVLYVGDLTGTNLYVCNLAGQDSFGRDKRYTDYKAVRTGLKNLEAWRDLHQRKMHEFLTQEYIYIPYKIGCNNGGGDWSIVSNIIEEEIPKATICRWE